MSTAADADPELARLLGRVSQAASFLEASVEAALIRILPMTDPMGTVVFSSNSVSRNLTILTGLLSLPEVTVTDEWRERLRGHINEVQALLGDRNRLLHGRIIDQAPGSRKYFLIQHQSDHRGDRSSAAPLDLAYVEQRLSRMQELAGELLSVPHAEYDLTLWEKGWRQYPTKPSSTDPKPARGRQKDRS